MIDTRGNIDLKWYSFLSIKDERNKYNHSFKKDGVDYSRECPCAEHANLTTIISLESKGNLTPEWKLHFAEGCLQPSDYAQLPKVVIKMFDDITEKSK